VSEREESPSWSRFYDAARDEPWETLVLAAGLVERAPRAPGQALLAVDLGCGAGRDTAELLRRGWYVIAIDAEPEAIRRLRARDLPRERLRTEVARFEQASWPENDLVNASASLPFCHPARFTALWRQITESLHPGGCFSGHFFGERDEWAEEPGMTFQSTSEVRRLLEGLDVHRFDEVERDGETVTGRPKHWHLFHVVAQKPA
jgi:SAM-dependent methyltransferase